MRIELTPSAWKAEVLPLNYIRINKLERKTRFELATLALARRCSTTEPLAHNGAQNRNRTSDTWIFSPLLYQLSYLGISKNFGKLPETGIEPVRVLPRRILSPVRLPVPPLGLKPFPFIYFAIS